MPDKISSNPLAQSFVILVICAVGILAFIFLIILPSKKTSTDLDREIAEKKRKMKMGDIHKDEAYLITQGIYSEKEMLQGAWQFVVNRKTGELHISGLEHGYSYFFDGACKK